MKLSQVEYAPKHDASGILTFYMGKNTPERKDFIMREFGGGGGGVSRNGRDENFANWREFNSCCYAGTASRMGRVLGAGSSLPLERNSSTSSATSAQS